MHDRSWCDPDEVKMDPDCMLSPPDDVRVIVQGEVVGPASIGKFLMKDILYIMDCALKRFLFYLLLCAMVQLQASDINAGLSLLVPLKRDSL